MHVCTVHGRIHAQACIYMFSVLFDPASVWAWHLYELRHLQNVDAQIHRCQLISSHSAPKFSWRQHQNALQPHCTLFVSTLVFTPWSEWVWLGRDPMILTEPEWIAYLYTIALPSKQDLALGNLVGLHLFVSTGYYIFAWRKKSACFFWTCILNIVSICPKMVCTCVVKSIHK